MELTGEQQVVPSSLEPLGGERQSPEQQMVVRAQDFLQMGRPYNAGSATSAVEEMKEAGSEPWY